MAASQDFGVTVEAGADGTVVRVKGDLDMSSASGLIDAITEAGGAGGTVVADLSDVTFMDSSALNALVTSARLLSEQGGRLAVGERSAVVERILQITGLADGTGDFDVHPVVDGGSDG
jgi:anti-anti-sigma factor